MNTSPTGRSLMLLALAALMVAAAPATYATPDKATVGVVLPKAQLGSGGDVSEPLRQNVLTQLRASGMEAVPLEASAEQQADAEARGKNCSYVLYTRVEQKHGGGNLFSKLAPFAAVLPGALAGHAGGSALTNMAAQSAANAAASAAQQQAMSQMLGAQSGIKRGDTVAFDYRLVPVGSSTPVKSDTLQGKADADGQDVLSPMVQRLASAVSGAAQPGTAAAGGAAAAAAAGAGAAGAAAADSSASHGGVLGGLFGHHNSSAQNKSASPSGQEIDCAKIASMPQSVFSQGTCEQMKSSQQAYNQALSDPSASRPGDEQMTCEQILAELKQQQYTVPDKNKVAEGQAVVAHEQQMMAEQQAAREKRWAAEQSAVEAAAMTDRATEAATMGLVNTNRAAAAAQAAQDAERIQGEKDNAARRPTEQKMTSMTGDFASDAGKQLTNNPRLARLTQLANTHHCHGS